MTSLTPCNKIDKPLDSSCIVLELLFTETSPDDKYSGTPPPTSPNSITIQDTGDLHSLDILSKRK